jgi:ABC-type phosphate/phosphonate transport system substrate-binding protein
LVRSILQISKIVFMLIFIANFAASGQMVKTRDNKTLLIKMGYSSVMLQDTKPADAKAAIYVWVEVIKKKILIDYNQISELVPYIYYSLAEMENALNRKEIDILGLTSTEYFALKDKYNLIPAIAGTIDDSFYTQYILITRLDSNIKEISDLHGRILAQAKDQFNPLINVWLYNILNKQKEPDKNKFFSKVKYEEKESNAVYSVYFKKADCTIIQKSVFNTICTLNPQFKNSFKILETSPDLILGLTVIRKNTDREVIDMYYKVAKNIHQTTEGQNIIKLFRTKKLLTITDKDLTSTKQLIDSYNVIRKKR